MTKLTTEATDRLAVLCGIVRKGMETFVEVGNALMEIKESGLYKDRCSTFEAFVQIEFGFSRAHAYRQIAAAEVVAGMSPNETKPESAAVALPLVSVPPAKRSEVLEEAREAAASEGRKVTAKHVTEAAKVHRKEKARAKHEPDGRESADEMTAALARRTTPVAPSGAVAETKAPEASDGTEDEASSEAGREAVEAQRGSSSEAGAPAGVPLATSNDLAIDSSTAAVREVVVVGPPAWVLSALSIASRPLTDNEALAMSEGESTALLSFGIACTTAAKRCRVLREKAVAA